ncbi:hypothetical protein [Streptomyces sp. NPDC001275]
MAVASSVLPYSLNLEALRRIPPRVFGALTSLEPAAGAVFGLAVLRQHLRWPLARHRSSRQRLRHGSTHKPCEEVPCPSHRLPSRRDECVCAGDSDSYPT